MNYEALFWYLVVGDVLLLGVLLFDLVTAKETGTKAYCLLFPWYWTALICVVLVILWVIILPIALAEEIFE